MKDDITDTELNIRIDHLIIEGITMTFYQQQQLKESIETELAGFFSDRGIPKGIESARARIPGESIQINGQQPEPNGLGKQIAASIYNGLAID